MRVLLVEDNHDLAANIGEFLSENGAIVDYAMDGLTGLHLAVTTNPDVLILDISLPGMDGLTLCQRLRQDADSTVPILMLTARDTEKDKLAGFRAGSDDYLTKPFSLPELEARLQALVRRSQGHKSVLKLADLHFDIATLTATRGGRTLDLTPATLKLLRALMQAAPAVVSREQAEQAIWGDSPPDSDAALRGHVHALRQAVDAEGAPPLLHTRHGVGYRLVAPDEGQQQ